VNLMKENAPTPPTTYTRRANSTLSFNLLDVSEDDERSIISEGVTEEVPKTSSTPKHSMKENAPTPSTAYTRRGNSTHSFCLSDVSEDDESSIISESVIEEMPKNDWSPANSQKENMSEVQTADDEPDMYSWRYPSLLDIFEDPEEDNAEDKQAASSASMPGGSLSGASTLGRHGIYRSPLPSLLSLQSPSQAESYSLQLGPALALEPGRSFFSLGDKTTDETARSCFSLGSNVFDSCLFPTEGSASGSAPFLDIQQRRRVVSV